MTAQLVPGCVVIAQSGTKERPCVVLVVQADAVIVAACRGTLRDGPKVTVAEGSAAFRAMGLQKTSYFYPQVDRLGFAAIRRVTDGRCPPEIFVAIRKLVGFR